MDYRLAKADTSEELTGAGYDFRSGISPRPNRI